LETALGGQRRRHLAAGVAIPSAARVFFAGGGLVVPLGSHLRVSGDVGFLVLIERERAPPVPAGPRRPGLAFLRITDPG
jgi:hypothetical protein